MASTDSSTSAGAPVESFHLTLSSDGRKALFPSEELRRQAVQAIARVAGPSLLLFSVVDDHVHVVILHPPDHVGRLARALLLALRPMTGPALSPAHVRPVDGRSHLEWLVGYCLRQPVKHGLGVHPALWTGSCFLDLVGARYVPEMSFALREALPRLRQRDLFAQVGLAPERLLPLDDEALRFIGHDTLLAAATAALAAPPDLDGRAALVVACRRAVAQLGTIAGLTTGQLARLLRVQPAAARRLAQDPVDPRAVQAVRLRLALEQRVRDQGLGVGEGSGGYEVGGEE